MHQNAVNNLALTQAERSAHSLASTSLVPLCKTALEGSVTITELWCASIVFFAPGLLTFESNIGEAFSLSCRAEQALSDAADALNLGKYLDYRNMKEDDFSVSGDGAGETIATSSQVPAASKLASPRVSVHDITEVRQTPVSAKLKEKALVLLNVNERPPQPPPLGRAHTMPSMSQTTTSSRTGRAPSRASRGRGLHALQEE